MLYTAKDNTFKNEVINSKIPVLVEFYASWSPPCKALSEVLKNLCPNYKKSIKFVKANIKDCENIVSRYKIFGFPTLLLIKNGKILRKLIGFSKKEDIINFLNKYGVE